MSGNFKKEDLRIIKTNKALMESLQVLLKKRVFKQITVNDICEEALISRATFYAHFYDKYDLLEKWLIIVGKDLAKNVDAYEETAYGINRFIIDNSKITMNLVDSTDEEATSLLQNFLLSFLEASLIKTPYDKDSSNHMILSTFCAGGLYNLLLWQVKNNFPPQMPLLNSYSYRLLECIVDWDAQQEQQ